MASGAPGRKGDTEVRERRREKEGAARRPKQELAGVERRRTGAIGLVWRYPSLQWIRRSYSTATNGACLFPPQTLAQASISSMASSTSFFECKLRSLVDLERKNCRFGKEEQICTGGTGY